MSDRVPTKSGPATPETTRKLTLFIAEGEPHSLAARTNLQKFLDTYPGCRCEVQVVNVLEDYQTALTHRVLLTPCLIQLEPPPRVMIVGTLQDMDRIRIALRLNEEETEDV